MKRSFVYLVVFIVVSPLLTFAQDNNYEALALLFAKTNTQGSARMQALGGTHAALGADVTTLSGNPAGLGFYTRSEVSFSPMINLIKNNSEYLGTSQSANTDGLNIGNFGVVFAGDNRNPVGSRRWIGGALGISYSRQNVFNNNVSFGGRNQNSSMADYFAEQVNADAASVGATALLRDFRTDLNANGNVFDFPTSMYYYGLLAEPTSAAGTPYIGTEPGKTTEQTFDFTGSGHNANWNFSYGANYMNKLYVGVGIARARMTYTTKKTMQERFVNPVAVAGFEHTNELVTNGRGWSATLGLMYRPNDILRFGLNYTSPTWMNITESVSQSLQTDLVRPLRIDADAFPDLNAGTTNFINDLQRAGFTTSTTGGNTSITSVPKLSILPFESSYRLRTPSRLNAGMAVFFGKNGFISGDVEVLDYGKMRLRSSDENASSSLQSGRVTEIVRGMYRNVLNYKVGGEYRFNHISLRAGAAFFQDPFVQNTQFNNLDRSRTSLSGGLGYRNNDFYVDAAVVSTSMKSAYSPYILANTRDYASALTTTRANSVVFTVGTFF